MDTEETAVRSAGALLSPAIDEQLPKVPVTPANLRYLRLPKIGFAIDSMPTFDASAAAKDGLFGLIGGDGDLRVGSLR